MSKVKSIRSINQNTFLIVLENKTSYELLDETIIKFKIILNKNILDIKEVLSYNELMKVYFKYQKKLIKKYHTEKEIENLLYLEGLSNDEIDILLIKYKKLNIINDNNYVKAFVNDSINLKLDGPNKIKNTLLLKGISLRLIDDGLSLYNHEFWQDRVNKIVLKKQSQNHKYSNIELKNKIDQKLYSLGYSNYNYALDVSFEKYILIKEYNRLLKKYNYDIALEKIYQRGFSKDNISFIKNKKQD